MKLFILYENEDWLEPLCSVLDQENLEYQTWFVDDGQIDLAACPPEGIFLNRLSASASTRGHHHSLTQGEQLIGWLEAWGRRVINGGSAIALERSKLRQYLLLQRWKLQVPRSIIVTGSHQALEQANQSMSYPFVYKYNCGGKGLGVQLINNSDQWQQLIAAGSWQHSPDQVHILQQYIETDEPFITRCEFIGGRFLYAIKADTSQGFELCPAQGCEVERCVVGESEKSSSVTKEAKPGQNLFSLRRDWYDPIIRRYEAMLQAEGIDVAGIEFMQDKQGQYWTYDINCNTNYSPKVEEDGSVQPGLQRLVEFLRTVIAEKGRAQ